MSIPLTVIDQIGPFGEKVLLRCVCSDINQVEPWLNANFGSDYEILSPIQPDPFLRRSGTHFSIVVASDVAMYLKLAQ